MYKNMLKSSSQLEEKSRKSFRRIKDKNRNKIDVNSIFLNIHNQRTLKINFYQKQLYTFNNNWKEKNIVVTIYY